jgi:putative addiction module component (TIGR02574 family)
MNQVVSKLAEQASQLTPDERVELIETILVHLPESDPEWAAAWMAEVEKRMDAVERGEAELIPAEEMLARLKGKYRAR